jgi:hypothetical protein
VIPDSSREGFYVNYLLCNELRTLCPLVDEDHVTMLLDQLIGELENGGLGHHQLAAGLGWLASCRPGHLLPTCRSRAGGSGRTTSHELLSLKAVLGSLFIIPFS